MPIYEYQCATCGHQLEAFQSISEEPLTLCPECHHATLNKLVSAAGFQLKGSGWYVTDYSNKNKPKQASSGSEGSSESASGKETQSETKADSSKSNDSSSSSNNNSAA